MSDKTLKNLSKILGKTIEEKRDLRRQQQADRDTMIFGMGEDIVNLLLPLLKEIAQVAKVNKLSLLDALKHVKVQANIKAPDVKVPEVKVNIPEIKVPPMPEVKVDTDKIARAIENVKVNNIVDVPPIKIPDIRVPEIKMPDEMDIRGWVRLQGVDLDNPLPVQLRDSNGKPLDFMGGLTQIVSGGGGGKSDFFTIKDIRGSSASIIDQVDGALKVTGSFSASLAADTGSGEIGSETLRIVQATDAVSSVNVTNTSITVDGALDTVKATGIAMQTNPTAVSDGDNVRFKADDVGRQINTPVQVRDLRATAYVALSNGTETTLLSGSAGVYHDLIYVMGANNSDAAVSVDIRAVTAGNIAMGLEIPANGTAGVSLPVPYPQSDTNNNWTVDMGDITGTTVKISALFSKEV